MKRDALSKPTFPTFFLEKMLVSISPPRKPTFPTLPTFGEPSGVPRLKEEALLKPTFPTFFLQQMLVIISPLEKTDITDITDIWGTMRGADHAGPSSTWVPYMVPQMSVMSVMSVFSGGDTMTSMFCRKNVGNVGFKEDLLL